MVFHIYDEFVHFIIWPHIVVYILYFIVKYLSFLSFSLLYHRSGDYSFFCVFTCGCFCRCCCNCCCCTKKLLTKAIKYNLKFDRWLIKLLLGREEGVVERHHDDYRPDEDSEGKPFAPIYIRNKSLSYNEVSILITLVLTFGLLIGITAFDVYFLDVSYACTDDRTFSCFVLPVNIDTNETELGITKQRINSCSPWENSNTSDQVYVVCYKWVYNLKGVTVVAGSLFTLFQLTIKATTSIFISLNAYLHKNDHFTVKKIHLKLIRIASSGFVFGIEVMVLINIVIFTTIYLTSSDHNKIIRYLIEHGNQVLLIFGIITTCLLLPIEDYIQDSNQQNSLILANELSENKTYQATYGSNEASA